jgi:hypothetical protein
LYQISSEYIEVRYLAGYRCLWDKKEKEKKKKKEKEKRKGEKKREFIISIF